MPSICGETQSRDCFYYYFEIPVVCFLLLAVVGGFIFLFTIMWSDMELAVWKKEHCTINWVASREKILVPYRSSNNIVQYDCDDGTFYTGFNPLHR